MASGLQKDIRLLHYRAWRGQFNRPLWSIWPIARVALAMLLRRKLFWTLYAAGLLFFLMFFFGTYLLDWTKTQIPQSSFNLELGKDRKVSIGPEQVMTVVSGAMESLNGSQRTFLLFFNIQGPIVVIVLALVGAVLVGNDFTYNSMPFYMAKPVSRWHYILGKFLAVGVVVNMLTTLPAVILWFQKGFDDWDYFANPDHFNNKVNLLAQAQRIPQGPAGLPLLLGILGYGLVLTGVLSIMLVAMASWMRRTLPLVMSWSALFLFFRLVSELLVDQLHWHEAWRVLDLWNNLRLVGASCLQIDPLRVDPQPQPPVALAALVLGVVCLVCLNYLNLRTRAVEIVR